MKYHLKETEILITYMSNLREKNLNIFKCVKYHINPENFRIGIS